MQIYIKSKNLHVELNISVTDISGDFQRIELKINQHTNQISMKHNSTDCLLQFHHKFNKKMNAKKSVSAL